MRKFTNAAVLTPAPGVDLQLATTINRERRRAGVPGVETPGGRYLQGTIANCRVASEGVSSSQNGCATAGLFQGSRT